MTTNNDTSTRYIGLCAACGNNHKVRGLSLVHHGYTRPGDGFGIVGDCVGVDHLPHEVSPRLAEQCQASLTKQIAELKQARAATPKSITTPKTRYSAEEVSVPSDGDWENKLRARNYRLDQMVAGYEVHLARIEGLLVDWKPVTLTTVEEDIDRQTAEKKAARQAKADAKQAKADEKAAKAAARAKRSEELDAKRLAKAKFKIGDDIGFTRPRLYGINQPDWTVQGMVTKVLVDSGEKGREVHYELDNVSRYGHRYPQSYFAVAS